MTLSYLTLDGMTVNKVDTAIERIRQYEPPEGYYVGFSGGKDSIVVLDLVKKSGVKYEAHFSKTTVDPPEVLKFIKDNYPDVIWERPRKSMFQLIYSNSGLPTRLYRFCCRALKEVGGKGRIVITGIRHEESRFRRERKEFEESAHLPGKYFLNPIITWSTLEVWQYIRENNLKYCCLYDEGKERIGCIMCPMQGTRGMIQDSIRYPKFYRAYLLAIRRVLEKYEKKGKSWVWGTTPEEVMHRWIYGSHHDGTIQTTLDEEAV